MTRFQHVTPERFLIDAFRLGREVFESGFRPKRALSIWRGGTPVGLGVDEFFRSRGVQLEHTTVATESYSGPWTQGDVVVKGLAHLVEVVCREDGLLIVDDVLDSGRTIRRILELLRQRARANMPEDVRVAAVHRKPDNLDLKGVPVIALEDLPGDVWIDYPHELADLVRAGDPEDGLIRAKDQAIWSILHGSAAAPAVPAVPAVPTDQAPAVQTAGGGACRYVGPRELLLDALRLGVQVAGDRSFVPDFLIALWPGGIGSGLPVHEVFRYRRSKQPSFPVPDHVSLNTRRTRSSHRAEVLGLDYLVERIEKHHGVLIVDTTFRSGQLVNDVLWQLKEALRRNLDLDRVRVAAVYYNPHDRSTWTAPRIVERPHYFVREVDHEVIYPHAVHKLPDPLRDLAVLNPALREVL